MIDMSAFATLSVRLKEQSAAARTLAAVVVRKSAADVIADAKNLSPVDTGALRSSIARTAFTDAFGVAEARVSPGVNYGIYQELGTSTMPPQPYLFPALDRRADGFTEAVAAIIPAVMRGG